MCPIRLQTNTSSILLVLSSVLEFDERGVESSWIIDSSSSRLCDDVNEVVLFIVSIYDGRADYAESL